MLGEANLLLGIITTAQTLSAFVKLFRIHRIFFKIVQNWKKTYHDPTLDPFRAEEETYFLSNKCSNSK